MGFFIAPLCHNGLVFRSVNLGRREAFNEGNGFCNPCLQFRYAGFIVFLASMYAWVLSKIADKLRMLLIRRGALA
jgi:hypothetical protein